MKKITLLLCLLFLSFCSLAQREFPKKGSSFTDPNLNALEGEWVADNGGTVLRIFLRKEVVSVTGGYSSEILIGYHEFEKNKKVVDSSMKYKTLKKSEKKSTVSLASTGKENMYYGTIIESSLDRIDELKVEYVPQSRTLIAKISELQGMISAKGHKKKQFPDSVVFIKVK